MSKPFMIRINNDSPHACPNLRKGERYMVTKTTGRLFTDTPCYKFVEADEPGYCYIQVSDCSRVLNRLLGGELL